MKTTLLSAVIFLSSICFAESTKEVKFEATRSAIRKKTILGIQIYKLSIKTQQGKTLGSAETVEALRSQLLQERPFQFELEFLRDVPAKKLETALKESLAKNKIPEDSPGFPALFAAWNASGDFKKGTLVIFEFQKATPTLDKVQLTSPQGTVTMLEAATGFAENVLKIWLGSPADNRMSDFQKSLLSTATDST